MNNEEKIKFLEASLLQIMKEVTELRYTQKLWNEHFGFQNRANKKRKEERIDNLIKQWGISEDTRFSHLRIGILREIVVTK